MASSPRAESGGKRPSDGSTPVPPRKGTKAARQAARRPAPRSGSQARQARRRNQRLIAIGATGLVVIVIAVLVAVKLSSGSSTNAEVRTAVSQSQVSQLSGIPVSTLVEAAQAAQSSAASPPTALPAGAKPLTSAGKPEILYMGAEYCPYCAAERWPMVMALSKFGTFNNLHATKSSSTDVNANTPTFTFVGSSYSSPYLAFTPVEMEDRAGKPLQNPTAQQTTILSTYDAPPYTTSTGTIPFVYLGGKFIVNGTQYDAAALAGKSFSSAVSYITSANNPTSRAAEAVAGHLVGAICTLTNNQPANVCTAVPASLKTGVSSSANQGSSTGG